MSAAEASVGGSDSAPKMSASTATPLPASFRDPSGFVFVRDGTLYRQVNQRYRADYELLMNSGLYADLSTRRLVVSQREVDVPPAEPQTAYRTLLPQRIGFISYPYEWSFSQLQDAALLTLDVQLLALERGMTLKDASAYNVQFLGHQPTLIDTLSFERYSEGSPWIAYRQYCQHFLAPLALMAYTDISLNKLLRTCIDGIPLDLASRLLPHRTRWRPGLGIHIHLHAKAQRAYAATDRPRLRRTLKVSRTGLIDMLRGLRKTTAALKWQPGGTEWGGYYKATNYTDTAFGNKKQLIEELVAAAEPKKLWDLGANTGLFSRLAASKGIDTVAFDIDPAAVEANYLAVRRDREPRLLPLLMDLTNPSPNLGWAGEERDSLFARAPVDCVMALALIHHLAISNNVPLRKLAQFFAGLCRDLIIEFVPKSDSQVQRLLASREDIFGNYEKDGFENSFSEFFEIVRRAPVQGSERTLYLMRRREGVNRSALII